MSLRAGWYVYAALDLGHRPGLSTAVFVNEAAEGKISHDDEGVGSPFLVLLGVCTSAHLDGLGGGRLFSFILNGLSTAPRFLPEIHCSTR